MSIKLPAGMDKVEAWSGDVMLGVGIHDVTIHECTEGKSRNDYPQLELRFQNDSGSIRDWLVISEASLGKVRQFLDAVGIEAEEGEMVLPVEKIEGRRLTIQVVEEPSRNEPGKMRKTVAAYRQLSTSDVPGGDDDIPF